MAFSTKLTGVEVVHLCQKHSVSGAQFSQDIVDNIVEYQFQIARYLINHPNIPVFVEGVHSNFENDAEMSEWRKQAKQIFRLGFPTDLSHFNKEQREFLYEFGGALAVFWVGKLPQIFGTIDPETLKAFKWRYLLGDRSFIMRPREKKAIEHIQKSLASMPQTKRVILVYGRAHDFALLCDEADAKYIRFELDDLRRANMPRPAAMAHLWYKQAKPAERAANKHVTVRPRYYSSEEELRLSVDKTPDPEPPLLTGNPKNLFSEMTTPVRHVMAPEKPHPDLDQGPQHRSPVKETEPY